MRNKNLLNKIIFGVCIFGFIAGLSAYVSMGLNMRLLGDDYCEAAIVTKYGFLKGQMKAFLTNVPFHGNRYTKTFLASFTSLFPPKTTGYLPVFLLIALCSGLFILQSGLYSLLNFKTSTFFRLLISLATVFFTFLLTPTVKQSLYWKSAMLPSTAPIIGTLLLVAFLIKRQQNHWRALVIIFILSIINGGLSENGVMLQFSLVSVFLFLFVVFCKNLDGYYSSLQKSFAAILGSIIAIFIMWLSPSISQERGEMAISIFQTIKLSLIHSWEFYTGFLRSYFIGLAAIFLIGLLAYLMETQFSRSAQKKSQTKLRNFVISLLLIHITVLILIFSNMIPSALTRNTYPDPRHLVIATFASVSGIFATGIIFGELLNFILKKLSIRLSWSILAIIGLGMIIITGLYTIRYIPQIIDEKNKFQYWAYQWDIRDRTIEEKVSSGQDVIHVVRMDSIIENVGELSSDPEYWYNLCASDYYGVSKIYADLPGWDEGWYDFTH